MSTGSFCRFLGWSWPWAMEFRQEGYAGREELAASRRSRILAQADNGGGHAPSAIPAWQRGGGVSVRERVLVIGHRVHVVTRFVGVGPRSARWRFSGRRDLPRAQVAENNLHQASTIHDRDDAHGVFTDGVMWLIMLYVELFSL